MSQSICLNNDKYPSQSQKFLFGSCNYYTVNLQAGGFGYFIIKENVDNMIDFNIFEEATKFIAAKIVF